MSPRRARRLTFPCASGGLIPIEERAEATNCVVPGTDDSRPTGLSVANCRTNAAVANPAFDVTLARFVSAIITERAVARRARCARFIRKPPMTELRRQLIATAAAWRPPD